MTRLADLAQKVRSKNAGPFWLTVDVFFDDADTYHRVCAALKTPDVAKLFAAEPQLLKRFEIDDLRVLKFSFPRPAIQGTPEDRDMHGAAAGALLGDVDIP